MTLPPPDLAPQARAVLNLDAYPFEDLSSEGITTQITEWQRAYRDDGMCIIPNFIRPDALTALVEEATALLPVMYQHTVMGNAYLIRVDESLAQDHPMRMMETTRTSTIACDQIPQTSALRAIYESPAMDRLVHRIVQADQIFHYDCAMGAVNVAVMEEGDYLRWHFDQSEFVVSIHLQDPEAGGHYEYVRNIRNDIEPHFDKVRSILTGGRENVETLSTAPGSLLVFRGKNTLHRVTKVEGNRPRIVLLYAYTLQPGVGSTDFLKQMRYGRTTPWQAD